MQGSSQGGQGSRSLIQEILDEGEIYCIVEHILNRRPVGCFTCLQIILV